MGRKPGGRDLTPSEARLLQVLAETGPATVRRLYEVMYPEKEIVYTTVLRTAQNMFEKGILERDSEGKSHIYRAAVKAETSRRSWIGQILKDAFRGSVSSMVLHAVDPKRISDSELDELERTVQELRRKKREEAGDPGDA